MSATSDVSFAQFVLDRFPPLLTEMIRAGATPRQLRDEGFTAQQIGAAQELVFQVDAHKRLAADTELEGSLSDETGGTPRPDATAEPVTGWRGD